jgi:hypothetical protein
MHIYQMLLETPAIITLPRPDGLTVTTDQPTQNSDEPFLYQPKTLEGKISEGSDLR